MATNKKVIKLSDRQKRYSVKDKVKDSFKFDQRMKYIAVIIAALIGVFLGFMPNAYKITINGVEVGAVKDKKTVEMAKETVITQLQNAYGTEVKFEEEPEIEKYRAKKKDYIASTYLISYMRKNMNILISFKEIYIEDEAVGIVASDEEVELLKNELKKKYYGESEVEVEFGKKVEVKDKFAKESELISVDKLVEKCTVTTPKVVEYEVKAGDTLSGIAVKLNTTIDNVVSANEGFTSSTILRLGQTIKANINEPLLPLNIVEQDDNTEQEEEAAE